MEYEITAHELLSFAKQHAGSYFDTLAQKRRFMLDVIDDAIVCYPASRVDVWLSPDIQIPRFNATNSFRTRDYPAKTFSNSYFVALVAALLGRNDPTDSSPQRTGQSLLPSTKLERTITRLRRSASHALPPVGNKRPPRQRVVTEQVLRDPEVAEWVLRTSKGRCASCLSHAPFRGDDGLPFLEVHHVIPLADGGPDTISNAVAVCPNCHRAFHHASDRRKRTAALYRRIARLKR